MLEFISTDMITIITFLSSKIPALLKYIIQFSTPRKQAKATMLPIQKLTAAQLQESHSHPSAIIQQTLKTVATIQTTLNLADAKAQTLAAQRSDIDATLKQLRVFSHKDTT